YCLKCSPFGAHNTRLIEGSLIRTERTFTCAACSRLYIYKRKSSMSTRLCPACQVIQYRRRAKERAVALKGGKCQMCGYNRCLAALEFHHLDPSQKQFNISLFSRSWKRVMEEIHKCVLVCANCHREL